MPDGESSSGSGAPADTGTGPIGQGAHAVQQGECTESIAFDNGLFWETIWNDPNNAELRRARQSPNALLPGDKLHVPERQEGSSSGETEKRHRFKRKGVPSTIQIVLKEGGEPRTGVPYTLTIDGKFVSGTTDGQGA